MNWLMFVVFLCFFPLLLVLLSKWRFSYWKRRGVDQLEPEFLYGDLRQMLTGKISPGENLRKIYTTFKNRQLPFGGIYLSYKPQFVPLDLNLIKEILQKSFSHFHDRGLYNHENDILTQNLFRIDGEYWKNLRAKLSPTFTSSRMKMMFDTLLEKTAAFDMILEKCIREGGKINVTDVAGRFTTDVIGSCAFGIECDTLNDGNSDFRKHGKHITYPRALKQWMESTFPRKLLGYTGYKSFPDQEEFFKGIVLDTIQHREKHELFRKDFMHLLLQLRNRGKLFDDGKIIGDTNQIGILTDDEIVAQCFLFFAAGFDTTSTTLSYAFYELAKNQEIQDKIRREIHEVLEKTGGKLTYEGAKELSYTDQVICETLRKYPILPVIPRLCTKRYPIPNTNIVIDKGTQLQIPVWAIQMDPEYYPNPGCFDPDRFNDVEKTKRPDFSYLPFGEGPRNCIGARFGMLQAKVGLVGLVKDYKFSLLPETVEELSFKPFLILLHSTQDILLKIEKI